MGSLQWSRGSGLPLPLAQALGPAGWLRHHESEEQSRGVCAFLVFHHLLLRVSSHWQRGTPRSVTRVRLAWDAPRRHRRRLSISSRLPNRSLPNGERKQRTGEELLKDPETRNFIKKNDSFLHPALPVVLRGQIPAFSSNLQTANVVTAGGRRVPVSRCLSVPAPWGRSSSRSPGSPAAHSVQHRHHCLEAPRPARAAPPTAQRWAGLTRGTHL